MPESDNIIVNGVPCIVVPLSLWNRMALCYYGGGAKHGEPVTPLKLADLPPAVVPDDPDEEEPHPDGDEPFTVQQRMDGLRASIGPNIPGARMEPQGAARDELAQLLKQAHKPTKG